MDKTIGQIQEEAEIVKNKIIEVLNDFLIENPSVCLSGEFGVSRQYEIDFFLNPILIGSEIDLTLKINIDEK